MISRMSEWRKSIVELREAVDKLQKQLNEMSSRMSFVPTPPRENWTRYSSPVWELDTLLLPQARRSSKHLALVKPPTAIRRVTICFHGSEQFVTAYGRNPETGRNDVILAEYSGAFKKVGMKVLEEFGEEEWEVIRPVTESA